MRTGVGVVLVAIVGGMSNGCTCSNEETPNRGEASSVARTGDRPAKSGYGLSVGHEDFELSNDEKRALMVLARAAVETWVRNERLVALEDVEQRFPKLKAERACFVTLRQQGQLRGCIGSLEPRRSLADDVRSNAVSAAIHDTRFRPVSEDELASLSYSISVLDLPRPLKGVEPDELPAYLEKHRPGVIIEYRGRRSTFLPSVWEDLQDPEDFLSRLCMKQGVTGGLLARYERAYQHLRIDLLHGKGRGALMWLAESSLRCVLCVQRPEV